MDAASDSTPATVTSIPCARHFGWEAYDPFYGPELPTGLFDTVVCTNVLSALSRKNRADVIERVDAILDTAGVAYFAVPRNLPRTGRLGVGHTLQNYVVLSLPVIYEDRWFAVYRMDKGAGFKDKTRDHVSRRDARRDR